MGTIRAGRNPKTGSPATITVSTYNNPFSGPKRERWLRLQQSALGRVITVIEDNWTGNLSALPVDGIWVTAAHTKNTSWASELSTVTSAMARLDDLGMKYIPGYNTRIATTSSETVLSGNDLWYSQAEWDDRADNLEDIAALRKNGDPRIAIDFESGSGSVSAPSHSANGQDRFLWAIRNFLQALKDLNVELVGYPTGYRGYDPLMQFMSGISKNRSWLGDEYPYLVADALSNSYPATWSGTTLSAWQARFGYGYTAARAANMEWMPGLRGWLLKDAYTGMMNNLVNTCGLDQYQFWIFTGEHGATGGTTNTILHPNWFASTDKEH